MPTPSRPHAPLAPAAGDPRWPLWFLVAAVPFLALVWRFDWISDDAFISLRYARHLAAGQGLAWNPGENPPVEGYTNLLWVLAAAALERLGADAPRALTILSAACGTGLLALLARAVGRWSPDGWGTLPALLFAATLPPLAVWSTGGLATMPFALCLFAGWERLCGDDGRPRPLAAVLFLAAAVLLRADGFLFAGLVLAAALATGLLERERPLVRATLAAGLALAVVVAAHFAWRHAYHGDWLPNTARVKVGLSAMVLERGAKYLGAWLLTFLSIPLALLLGLLRPARPAGRRTLAPAAVVVGTLAFGVAAGGDFMTMGRLFVPALPFLALLVAGVTGSLRALGRPAVALVTAVLVALSLLPVAGTARPGDTRGILLAPGALREACHFRWSRDYETEYAVWMRQKTQARMWRTLGRALAQATRPGESLVHGTVGAVGYETELAIFDTYGLTNRFVVAEQLERKRNSPGHDRHVPLRYFLALQPTYLHAALAHPDAPSPPLPGRLRRLRDDIQLETIPVNLPELPAGSFLLLARYRGGP